MGRVLMMAVLAVASLSMQAETDVWEFEYQGTGGTIVGGVAFLPLDPMLGAVPNIQQPFQLEIHGLTHPNPDALDIVLIDPYGEAIDVMSDSGGSTAVSGINLCFRDDAGAPVGAELESGTYLTDGLAEVLDMGMGSYVGQSGGADPWVLVLINDVPVDGACSIDGWTLRGR